MRWKAFPVDKKETRRPVNLKTSALLLLALVLANECYNCILQVFLAMSDVYVSGIDLVSLYVLFSRHRSCDNAPEIK